MLLEQTEEGRGQLLTEAEQLEVMSGKVPSPQRRPPGLLVSTDPNQLGPFYTPGMRGFTLESHRGVVLMCIAPEEAAN